MERKLIKCHLGSNKYLYYYSEWEEVDESTVQLSLGTAWQFMGDISDKSQLFNSHFWKSVGIAYQYSKDSCAELSVAPSARKELEKILPSV